MSTLGPLPFVVWMSSYVLLAGVLARRWPFFVRERAAVSRAYNVPLEGLRGLLALSVFFYHGALTYVYFRTGQLGDVTRFYEHCGSSAVLLFFFLTGFLFWGKLLRVGAPAVLQFMRARAWRIGPAYVLSVALVVLISAARSHFRLVESGMVVAVEIVRWCCFGFCGFPDINAVPKTILANSGVFWTLEWEWVFYLVLPLLGWFARGRRVVLLAGVFACVYELSVARGGQGGLGRVFLTGFYPGMLTAHFVRTRFAARLAQSRWSALIPVVAIAAAILLSPKNLLMVPVLCVAFATIAAGVDVLGLLRLPGLIFLGRISYSTYILHGAVLFVGTRAIDRCLPIASMSPSVYWACIGALGIAVVLVSALSFQFVEHPFLNGVHTRPVRLSGAPTPQEA